jgi:hypothetical protein
MTGKVQSCRLRGDRPERIVPRPRFPSDGYVGFDCRSCSSQIPVYRVLADGQHTRDTHEPASSLIVMCPHCGDSSSYAGHEAYRFADEADAAGPAAVGGAE